MSDWIATYTGKQFHPLDPRSEDIDIRDIAHALSHICRFTGHAERFYSVAQHSVLAAQNAPAEYRLDALLHDASEAYICDVSKPVKHSEAMAPYRAIERKLMAAIECRYRVTCDSPIIKDIDNRLLATEKRDLLPCSPDWGGRWGGYEPYDTIIVPLSSPDAKREFLQLFYDLYTPL